MLWETVCALFSNDPSALHTPEKSLAAGFAERDGEFWEWGAALVARAFMLDDSDDSKVKVTGTQQQQQKFVRTPVIPALSGGLTTTWILGELLRHPRLLDRRRFHHHQQQQQQQQRRKEYLDAREASALVGLELIRHCSKEREDRKDKEEEEGGEGEASTFSSSTTTTKDQKDTRSLVTWLKEKAMHIVAWHGLLGAVPVDTVVAPLWQRLAMHYANTTTTTTIAPPPLLPEWSRVMHAVLQHRSPLLGNVAGIVHGTAREVLSEVLAVSSTFLDAHGRIAMGLSVEERSAVVDLAFSALAFCVDSIASVHQESTMRLAHEWSRHFLPTTTTDDDDEEEDKEEKKENIDYHQHLPSSSQRVDLLLGALRGVRGLLETHFVHGTQVYGDLSQEQEKEKRKGEKEKEEEEEEVLLPQIDRFVVDTREYEDCDIQHVADLHVTLDAAQTQAVAEEEEEHHPHHHHHHYAMSSVAGNGRGTTPGSTAEMVFPRIGLYLVRPTAPRSRARTNNIRGLAFVLSVHDIAHVWGYAKHTCPQTFRVWIERPEELIPTHIQQAVLALNAELRPSAH